jgi:antitoxin VapB
MLFVSLRGFLDYAGSTSHPKDGVVDENGIIVENHRSWILGGPASQRPARISLVKRRSGKVSGGNPSPAPRNEAMLESATIGVRPAEHPNPQHLQAVRLLLVSQGFNGVQAGGASGGPNPGEYAHGDRHQNARRADYGILPSGGRILQSLNLKNPRAYSLASEISHLTGESLTAVVIAALEQRLAAERQKRGGSTTAERILAFAKRFAQGIPPGIRSADHADLYGEDGMPR